MKDNAVNCAYTVIFWHLNWIAVDVLIKLLVFFSVHYVWDQMIQPITSFANGYFRNYNIRSVEISLISFRIFHRYSHCLYHDIIIISVCIEKNGIHFQRQNVMKDVEINIHKLHLRQ